MTKRRFLRAAATAAVGVAILAATASAAPSATAPSQEVPPLSTLGIVLLTPGTGQAGYPTFRWKFPARDGTSTNWVTMDDNALHLGQLDPPGDPVSAYASFWVFERNITREDGTSSGPGWVLYFGSRLCGGTNWWVIIGSDPAKDHGNCPPGAWEQIATHLAPTAGTWLPVGPDFKACGTGMQDFGGECLARFIPADDMSAYIVPKTDVQIYDGQSWDVTCPPGCWATQPPSADFSVDVSAAVATTPVPAGTTSDSVAIDVKNPHANELIVSSISASLPIGFSYVPGSTGGFMTRDPVAAGQTLTWPGPFSLGANNGVSLHFDVKLDPSLPEGDYDIGASARTDRIYAGSATLTIGSGKRPLIFVPGIMGSEIADSCPPIFGLTTLWPTAAVATGLTGSAVQLLGMTASGEDVAGPGCLSVGGVLQNVTPFLHYYDQTFSYLTANGYALGGDHPTLFPFPYDWRQSAVVNGGELAAYVNQVLRQTHADKVDILAHSQGGLVTTAALESGALTGKVNRVVTLGTPLLGAAKALGLLEWGNPCPFNTILGVCPIDTGALQSTVDHMPGYYELLPSAAYTSSVGGPMFDADGNLMPYAQWSSLVSADHDAHLVTQAEMVHASIFDSFDPNEMGSGFAMERFAGIDKSTIWALQLLGSHIECWPPLIGTCQSVTDGRLIFAAYGGDGTVPLGSALPPSGITGITFPGVSHMALAQDPHVLALALAVLHASASVRFERLHLRGVASVRDGIQLETVGDATGTVSAAAGGELGENVPAAAAAIPGGAFDRFLRSRYYTFDDPGDYTADLHAGGTSPVTVVLRRYGDAQQESLFYLPAPTAATQLLLTFHNGEDLASATIGVDGNGDGVVDETLTPIATVDGALPRDGVPPITIGGANLVRPGVSTVTLLAQDDPGGVGVAATYVLGPGSSQPQLYSAPFTAPLGSTVQFMSIDRLGNVESVQKLIVDDVSNARQLAAALTPKAELERYIDPQGDVDWFTFTADGTSTYRAQLFGLTQDYDLELYDADGNLVAAPHTRSAASEEIRQKLSAGMYYLRVSGYDGAWDAKHPYHLKLQTLGN